ncbi:hypothetical protein DXB18_10840 [Clostridium sp. OM02-18AC]|nr:hypothetical protein DXB18_10840 [Clostridium sp. OM02-18AC]
MVCGCVIQAAAKTVKLRLWGKLPRKKAASANRIYAKRINSKSFIKKTYKIFRTGAGALYNSGSVPYNGAYVIIADTLHRKGAEDGKDARCKAVKIGEYDDN